MRTFRSVAAAVLVAALSVFGVIGMASPAIAAPGDIDHLGISSSSNTVRSGESLTFTVTAFDGGNAPVALAPGDAVLTNALNGATITGLTIRFGEMGSDTVTATVGSITVHADVEVLFGAVATRSIGSVLNPINAGESSRFYAHVYDAYGNREVVTESATFSSPLGVFSGDTGTFTTAGEITVTGTVGDWSQEMIEWVFPGPVDHIVVTDSTSGPAVAGQPRSYTATSHDVYGNLIDDVTADTTFSSSGHDAVSGAAFTFEQAGSRTITAQWNSNPAMTASLGAVVVGNKADPARLTIHASSTKADQKGSITITVTGVDRFGNPLTGLEHDATITSSVATDVVSGNRISFPHASPHTITVTLGSASTSLVVEVRSTAALAATGADSGWMLLVGALLLGAGILTVVLRGRMRDLPVVS